MKSKIIITLIAFIGLIISMQIFIIQALAGMRYAYVACEDRRIYKVDIDKGEIVSKSDEIKDMGRPTAIDMDKINGKLYVASERGHWQLRYSPIIVIDIKSQPMKMINKFDLIVEKSDNPYTNVSAVYEIVVSPDGKYLYAGYAHPKYSKGTTVIDTQTGMIIGHLDFVIDERSIFSTDGSQIANIWPGGSKFIKKNGQEIERRWDGGVAVYDINRNQMISKKGAKRDKIGLHPPWKKISYPLFVISNYKYLKAIDRDSGNILYEIKLGEVTGGSSTSRRPLVIDNGSKVVFSILGQGWQGYIVVIDLVNKALIKKIPVGLGPTNVVLSTY